MFTYVRHQKRKILFSITARLIVCVLTVSLVLAPTAGYTQSINFLNLPVPGAMVTQSPAFVPVLLNGMTIHPDNPFYFDFIVDSGNTDFDSDQIKQESERLVKYFLAAMTIPQNDLWVNLSPYEENRIIPDELGKTELGRDMLAQDYILKQLTASLMYPEKELGKKFWDRVYKKAQQKFGTTEISVNTFNKVWIVPDKAVVYEHNQSVYIVKSHLKVMLDADYLTQKAQAGVQNPESGIQTGIIREIILPAIEKEVNEGEHFALIRQIYHSLILAKWYKETIKESLLSKVYVDKAKIKGVDLEDQTLRDQIYRQYLQAFEKGVFNFIKEDYDELKQEVIPRKYFSGGEKFGEFVLERTNVINEASSSPVGDNYDLSLRIDPMHSNGSSPVFSRNTTVQDLITFRRGISSKMFGEEEIELFGNTLRLIEDLKAKKIPIGLGTSNQNPDRILDAIGKSRSNFDVVLDGKAVENENIPSKPSKDFYLEVVNRLGANAGRAVVVEDAVSGIRSAVDGKFGFVIGLARKKGDDEKLKAAGADLVLSDIGDLTVEEIERLMADKLGLSTGHNVLEAVIFDMDGVISNTDRIYFNAWKLTFDEYLRWREKEYHEPFREFTEDDYSEYGSGRTSPEVVRSFLESRNIVIPETGAKKASGKVGSTLVEDYLSRLKRPDFQGGEAVRKDRVNNLIVSMTNDQKERFKDAVRRELSNSSEPRLTPKLLIEAAKEVIGDNINQKSAKIGIQNGTFNPITYGHISTSLAAMLGQGLDGVVLTVGGATPHRPYTLTHQIRYEMTKNALKTSLRENDDLVRVSGIRNEMFELFSGDDLRIFGNDYDEQQRTLDLAGYIWFFTANPNVNWFYIVGSDWMKSYGKKDERDLLETLDSFKAKVLYFLREDDTNEGIFEDGIKNYPWLKAIWEGKEQFFINNPLPSSADISGTKARKVLIRGEMNAEEKMMIPQEVVDLVASNSELREYYVLEFELQDRVQKLQEAIDNNSEDIDRRYLDWVRLVYRLQNFKMTFNGTQTIPFQAGLIDALKSKYADVLRRNFPQKAGKILVESLIQELIAKGYDEREIRLVISQHIKRIQLREDVDLSQNKWLGRLREAFDYWKNQRRSYDYRLVNVFGGSGKKVTGEFRAIAEDGLTQNGVNFVVYSGGSGVGTSTIMDKLTVERQDGRFKNFVMYNTRNRRADGNPEFRNDLLVDNTDDELKETLEIILNNGVEGFRIDEVDVRNIDAYQKALSQKLKEIGIDSQKVRSTLVKILNLRSLGEGGLRVEKDTFTQITQSHFDEYKMELQGQSGNEPVDPPFAHKNISSRQYEISLSERLGRLKNGGYRVFGEFDGVHYKFLPRSYIEKLDAEGKLISNLYNNTDLQAVSLADIERIINAKDKKAIYLLDTTPYFAKEIKKRFGNRITTVMISPIKTVAVIGASGFLGRKIYDQLSEENEHAVVGTSFQKGGFIHLDVTDENEVKAFIQKYLPDVLIYTPAVLRDETAVDPEKAHRVNVESIETLAKYFNGHFIYISSDHVFGDSLPVDRNASLNPNTEYGRQKAEGEKRVIDRFSERSTIIRGPIMYGYNTANDRDTFVKRVIGQIRNGEQIVVDNNTRLYPVLTDDVANLIRRVISNDQYGIKQISGNTAVTRFSLAMKIAKSYAQKVPGASFEEIKSRIKVKQQASDVPVGVQLSNTESIDITDLDEGVNRVVDKILTGSSSPVYEQASKILAKHGYTIINSPDRGGSSSYTFLAKDQHGKMVIIKYSDWDGISGNGAPWLRKQKDKLTYIQRKYPDASKKYYPRVLDYYDNGNIFYYVMEYFEGAQDITQYFLNDPEVDNDVMYHEINDIVTMLAQTHYAYPKKLPIRAYSGEVEDNLLNRALYRLQLLMSHEGDVYNRLLRPNQFKTNKAKRMAVNGFSGYRDISYFFEDLIKRKAIVINGKIYPNLPVLLRRFKKNLDEIQRRMGPSHFSHFVHSDLALRNILRLPDGSIKLIDVRGVNVHETSPSMVSVEYDLGKIAHSFFMEIVRNDRFALQAANRSGQFNFSWQYDNDSGVEHYLYVWKNYRKMLEENKALKNLIKEGADSRWVDYVFLLEIFNYLSDAIHRFSQDPSGRDPLMYYLQATVGLYEFLDKEGLLKPEDKVVINDQFRRHNDVLKEGERQINGALLDEIADVGALTVVAYNGPSGGGKTYYANSAESYLRNKGKRVERLSLDWFLKSRDKRNGIVDRLKDGSLGVSEYGAAAFDLKKFLSVLEQIRSFRDSDKETMTILVPHAYNRENGLNDKTEKIELHRDTIVIVEGVESVTEETSGFFDRIVMVDTDSNDALLDNILSRENEKESWYRQTEQALEERFKVLDLPVAQLIRFGAMGLHDFLIDNSDQSTPKLYEIQKDQFKRDEPEINLPDRGIVSPPLHIIENQVRTIEHNLGETDQTKIDQKVQMINNSLKSGEVILKGEQVDVLKDKSANEVVIGQIDRAIAEHFSYIHQTANAIVLTPDLKNVVLTRRTHSQKQYPRYLTIPGGHMFSGQTYKEAIIDELEEELELDSLNGELVNVETYAYGFDADTKTDRTKERRGLYVYRLTDDEYKKVLIRKNELEQIARGANGEEDLKKELEVKQFMGLGEVWSYHISSIDEIEGTQFGLDDGSPYGKTRFMEINDIVSGKKVQVPYTPDLFDHLISDTQLWGKVKDAISKMDDSIGDGQILRNDDNEETSSPIVSDRNQQVGGIDLNEINVDHRGAGVDIQFDPIQAQRILENGVDGFVPVIINLTPINSILPILGLEPANKEEEYSLSSLN